MASKDVNQIIKEIFTPVLSMHGFKRKGIRFQCIGDSVCKFLDIQTSTWGPEIFVNYFVDFQEIHEHMGLPKIEKWADVSSYSGYQGRLAREANELQDEWPIAEILKDGSELRHELVTMIQEMSEITSLEAFVSHPWFAKPCAPDSKILPLYLTNRLDQVRVQINASCKAFSGRTPGIETDKFWIDKYKLERLRE